MSIVLSFLSFLGSFVTGSGGSAVGTLGVALIGWFIQNSANNADARARFLSLIQTFEASGSLPAGLHAKWVAQFARLDDAIDAELAKEKAAADAAEKAKTPPAVPPAKT